MLRPRQKRHASTLALQWLTWLATSVALVVADAPAQQVRVTSLDGPLSADGESLTVESTLAADQLVELSKDGRGSFLIADEALVRLCEGAKASFANVEAGQRARVEIRQGALRATVRPESGAPPLRIDTPTASIDVLGDEVHVMVSPGSGTTVVSSLEGRMRVSRRNGSDTLLIEDDEQIAVTRGRDLGKAERFERDELARSSDCLRSGIRRASAVPASSVPGVSLGPDASVDAVSGTGVSADLALIVAADFPKDDTLFGDTATPSTLISELNKAGIDEETCDPITCNPVFQLPVPDICPPPPIPPPTGCIVVP